MHRQHIYEVPATKGTDAAYCLNRSHHTDVSKLLLEGPTLLGTNKMSFPKHHFVMQKVFIEVMVGAFQDTFAAVVVTIVGDRLTPVVVSLWSPTGHVHLMILAAVNNMPP